MILQSADMFLWDLCSQLHRYSPGRYSFDPWNCWTRFGTGGSMSFFGKRDLGGRGWKAQSVLRAWWEEADLGLLRQPYGEQLERDPPRPTLSSSPLHLCHPHIVPGLQHAALAQSKEVKASSVNSFAQDSVQSKARPDCRFGGVPRQTFHDLSSKRLGVLFVRVGLTTAWPLELLLIT